LVALEKLVEIWLLKLEVQVEGSHTEISDRHLIGNSEILPVQIKLNLNRVQHLLNFNHDQPFKLFRVALVLPVTHHVSDFYESVDDDLSLRISLYRLV